jgi:hypothetical protein
MNTQLTSSRPGRTTFNVAIALLALALAARCTTESGDLLTGGELTTGTIRVKVMSGDSPISAMATVKVTGPTERATRGAIGSTVTFAELPPGTYAVVATVSSRFIVCQSASANLGAGQTTTAEIICTRQIGTITGTVSYGGAPISGATITLSGPILAPTATTGLDGTFTFVAALGENTLTTLHQSFVCPVRTALVELGQTTTADISCTPKTTGSVSGRVVVSGNEDFGVGSALVTLTGHASLTTRSRDSDGHFAFDELAPGGYNVTATDFGMDCPLVLVDVQAARTTEVLVRCTFRGPIGSEIEGTWWYYRRLDSQTGSCPTPLPETGTGSMQFDSSNNTISIVGLDPRVTIVGPYDKDSGSYTGTGKTVLSDGSSVETDVSVTFYFDWWGYGGDPTAFSTDFDSGARPSDVMLRRYRDPGGNLICTERYQASGSR